VRLRVDDDLRRSRLTVFFRVPLVLPHLVWLYFWSWAFLAILVFNWFATLFAGESQPDVHSFTGRWVRYFTHINAYLFLVANPWPRFSGRSGTYPVDLELDPPVPQHRLITLFRIFLVIPAYVFSIALSTVAQALAVLGWFVCLALGRMPKGMRDLIAYCIRFQSQTWAYLFLLTSRYPSLAGVGVLLNESTPYSTDSIGSVESQPPSTIVRQVPMDDITGESSLPPGEGETERTLPATGQQAPASADMMQLVTKLDRAIKERRDADVNLVNWWLYALVLSWVTFFIYPLYLFFKRITRIDRFSERKRAYYDALIGWTERYARQVGKEDEVHHQLADLRSEMDAAYKGNLRNINAGLSFVLVIVTVGLYGLYVLYRMNAYWWYAQVLEQETDDALSQLWSRLGLMRYPISFTLDQSKRRSYAFYLILTIVTFGIWGLVWDYKIHTDPDNIYKEFHSVEDTVLQTVRAY
jgi:hypothetical protein